MRVAQRFLWRIQAAQASRASPRMPLPRSRYSWTTTCEQHKVCPTLVRSRWYVRHSERVLFNYLRVHRARMTGHAVARVSPMSASLAHACRACDHLVTSRTYARTYRISQATSANPPHLLSVAHPTKHVLEIYNEIAPPGKYMRLNWSKSGTSAWICQNPLQSFLFSEAR